ncbi:Glycosyl hydrolases family 2, sugar binding domain [Planctomycetes bacterium MalM25]|nr:Glycosyl hydrolases family 2, sugar binding domain [Planctomycetes bacterium MalM25]
MPQFRRMLFSPSFAWALLTIFLLIDMAAAQDLVKQFITPPNRHRPETWFHLIGGNVNKEKLTADLEAVSSAGLKGIQLFHGRGRKWPGVSPQIQSLSPQWEAMIDHVANESRRLGLRFTMQNCPGWAMSGGPWITPDKAMRHVISSRTVVSGGEQVFLALDTPQPCEEPWRDYRDIAVLAFPTPEGDRNNWLSPVKVRSNRAGNWRELLAREDGVSVRLEAADEPVWVEFEFSTPLAIRSIELPPVELLMARRNFDPETRILVQAATESGWVDLANHSVPRGTWQDRQPEYPLVLAVSDAKASRYRILFDNQYPIDLSYLRLSSAARMHDWRGQAGFALRSLKRNDTPEQAPEAWVSRSSIIDLSERVDDQGRLTWEAPSGDWTIVRFGHVNTGVKNKPAPPEATGFECDKLSPAGAEQHFAGYLGRVTRAGGPADRGRLHGMLIDSWECYTQTWTPLMERAFEERQGYRLRPWLPALAGWVIDSPHASERFLRDWRATISDLLVENYFGRMAQLSRDQGLRVSFETALGDVSPGDILEYFGRADIPMCEFWQPNDPHYGGLEAKPIAPTVSAAHIYGKPRIAAEAFTNIPNRWKDHPFALKNFADRAFSQGVTQLVFHTYTHNPSDLPPGSSFGSSIGSPFLRNQTWWKHMPLFTEYLARCQLMLEQGQPVADVLWYLGDDLDHKPRQDTAFPTGYRYDYLNADALKHRITVSKGLLRVPEGTAWRVLWLAPEQCRRLTPDTLEAIKRLLHAGATVIGVPPESNPSLSRSSHANLTFDALVNELWGPHPKESGRRAIGSGTLLWGGDLRTTLVDLGIQPDVAGARSAVWNHRDVGSTQIYFVAADRLGSLDANLRFRAKGSPEFWDPMTGQVRRAAVYWQGEHGTTVAMQLPAAGSTFVVFHHEPASPAYTSFSFNGKVLVDSTDTSRVDTGKPFPHFGLSQHEPIQPWIDPPPLVGCMLPDGKRYIAWNDGIYRFGRKNREALVLSISGTKTIGLEEDWELSFPPGWGVPDRLFLDKIQPWSDLPHEAVRHFSGSAIYKMNRAAPSLAEDERLWLDLGRVGDIATVSVNGAEVATLWAPPFRVDITPYAKEENLEISVEVTNTWHNRLVYDAIQPVGGRKTWTIHPPDADSALTCSGIKGPVSLRVAKVVDLPAGP